MKLSLKALLGKRMHPMGVFSSSSFFHFDLAGQPVCFSTRERTTPPPLNPYALPKPLRGPVTRGRGSRPDACHPHSGDVPRPTRGRHPIFDTENELVPHLRSAASRCIASVVVSHRGCKKWDASHAVGGQWSQNAGDSHQGGSPARVSPGRVRV